MARAENEPGTPTCLGPGSLAFAPTAGMRLAPEVLLQEYFRELAYGDSRNLAESSKERVLADAMRQGEVPDGDRILISTCRGRRRMGRSGSGRDFFAPPFPEQSRYAWFRKSSDRTIRDYLLGGALAHCDRMHDQIVEAGVKAATGARSAPSAYEPIGGEILSLIGIKDRERLDASVLAENFRQALGREASAPLKGRHDTLASTVAQDFVELADLEARLPRREWLYFLIAFLRVATAMWMLAHLQITIKLRDLLFSAFEGTLKPNCEASAALLSKRNEGLLHPTSTPTREILDHVERYMRARVELRILTDKLQEAHPNEFTGTHEKRLLTLDRKGRDCINLENFLSLARQVGSNTFVGDLSLRQWLTREAEKWPAWRSPRYHGQGKNIDEFLRVLRRSEEDESGSGLLIQAKNQTTTIIPGQRLLQLFAFLANRRKGRSSTPGRLVLSDLEAHLFDYGIDFRSSSYGRPLLLKCLRNGGLLAGSPDAAESAAVLDTLTGRQAT